jgi:hypothetical protein
VLTGMASIRTPWLKNKERDDEENPRDQFINEGFLEDLNKIVEVDENDISILPFSEDY